MCLRCVFPRGQRLRRRKILALRNDRGTIRIVDRHDIVENLARCRGAITRRHGVQKCRVVELHATAAVRQRRDIGQEIQQRPARRRDAPATKLVRCLGIRRCCDLVDGAVDAIDKALHHPLMLGRNAAIHAHEFFDGQKPAARDLVGFEGGRTEDFRTRAERAATFQLQFREPVMRPGISQTENDRGCRRGHDVRDSVGITIDLYRRRALAG